MKKVTAIVVDDDLGLLGLVRSLMEMLLDEEVPTFMNGADAWEFFKENEVTMVVSDVDMPFMNGLELLKKVREKNPQTIFISTSGRHEHATRAEELGADVFMGKPYKVADFQDVIKRFLHR